MTHEQLYIALGVPLLFNATLFAFVVAFLNAKIEKFEARFTAVNSKFDAFNANFEAVNARLDAIDKRFDDMRDLWRAELRRVEEVIDARLKQLEERG